MGKALSPTNLPETHTLEMKGHGRQSGWNRNKYRKAEAVCPNTSVSWGEGGRIKERRPGQDVSQSLREEK